MYCRETFALLLLCQLPSGVAGSKTVQYTSNAVCRQRSCVNPLFPGLNDLPRLEQLTWQCATNDQVKPHMTFCKDAVVYDAALPSPNLSTTAVDALVRSQDAAAVTMYFYHLSALGYDSSEYEAPEDSTDSCIRSIWEMVCYTYFPRAEAGCQDGYASAYVRPCKTSCHDYLTECNVECCDESAECVFTYTQEVSGVEFTQTGYVSEEAPSSMCTGVKSGSTRFATAPILLVLCLLGIHVSPGDLIPGRRSAVLFGVIAMAMTLQGCDMHVETHSLGNWRNKDDYLVDYQYIPPQGNATLNSCSIPDLQSSEQCSGRGYCKAWDNENGGIVSFCHCNQDYADPECRTKRKSQTTAFLYSLFLGFVGADCFYLGFPISGVGKLLTLGGFGAWWMVDIVRIGSRPVYSSEFRVASDLPHWLYVLCVVSLFIFIGFAWGISSYLVYRKKKRSDVMKLQEAEEFRTVSSTADSTSLKFRGPGRDFQGPHGFSGYGATLPYPVSNAGAPYAMPPPPGQEGRFAGPYGPASP